jgi:Reverse transcriptase (RNA-dependent DNA polymerase)
VFPKHVLQDYANQWAKWWQETDQAPTCDIGHDPTVPAITADQIKTASAHFRATTSAPDGLPPRSIALVSDQCRSALADLFAIFETHGWPTSERIVLTVLIPKKDGGLRPIALFRSLYRIYSKARAQEARAWAAGPGKSSLCNNSSGRWVGDGTWRNQVRMGSDTQVHRTEYLMDLKKAFEHVTHDDLIRAAKAVNYPAHLVRMALIAYTWPRRLVYLNSLSRTILPSRGIAAGSSTATFELWAVLKPAIDRIAAISPRLTVCLHVDDLCVHAADRDIETCEQLLIAAADTTAAEIHKLGMVFAPDKGFVLATTPSSAVRLAKQLAIPATAADHTTRLGVDYALQPTQTRTPVRWHRFAISLARAKRMPYLFKHGAPGIFSSGILPAALYGAEHQAIPPEHVQKLRHAAVRAWGAKPWGVPTDLAMIMYPTEQDPLYISIAAPLTRWAREVWMATDPHGPQDTDILSHTELVVAARAIQDPNRTLPQGPLLAVRQALAQLGWTMQLPYHYCNHTGFTLNLAEGTPALLRHHISTRFASLQERMLRDKLYDRPSAIVPHWPLVRRLVHTKKLQRHHKSALMSALYGTLPAPAWLAGHGWQVEAKCVHCGEDRTAYHEAVGCGEACPLRALLSHTTVPPRLQCDDAIQAYRNGTKVDEQDITFQAGIPIYTDGSAAHVQYSELATAAGAAFQQLPDGTRISMAAQAPHYAPHSAISGEAIGLELALLGLRRHADHANISTDIVADCAAIVAGIQAPHTVSSYRAKYGGAFRTGHGILINAVKVKAHMTRAEAAERHQAHLWEGNEHADNEANRARASIGPDGLAYIASQKDKFAQVITVLRAIVTALPAVHEIEKPKVYKALRRARLNPDPHEYVWHRHHWQCTKCGHRSHTRRLPGQQGCLALRRLSANLHSTHRLRTAACGDSRSTVPIVFCTTCGGYSSSRGSLLTKACRGTAATTQAVRLRAGVHPRDRAPLLNIQAWKPALSQPQHPVEGPPNVDLVPHHPPAPVAAYADPPVAVDWEDPYDADHEASIAIHGMAGLD